MADRRYGKIDILENMIEIKQNVTMIGDFTDRGLKLFTEKAAGSVCGCIGFVKDRKHTFEKGCPGCHCISGTESLCRPFQKLHCRKIFYVREGG